MTEPFFSVLITAYNRSREIRGCVESVIAQTFDDWEIVLVDDASRDDTAAVVDAIGDSRVRVIRHPYNQGILPTRATAIHAARGRWLVALDSDWELVPTSLARLAQEIDALAPDVRIIRSRLRMDDGSLSPTVIPTGVTDYQGRLAWLEAIERAGGASDAGHCAHRDVYEGVRMHDGHGAFEAVWETDLARREKSLWLGEVLGLEHLDAANSVSRAFDGSGLRTDAADLLRQVERMIREHGAALRRSAPTYRRSLSRRAAVEALLASRRGAGIRHTVAAARAGDHGVQLWAVLALGLVYPGLLARAKSFGRKRTRRRISVSADG